MSPKAFTLAPFKWTPLAIELAFAIAPPKLDNTDSIDGATTCAKPENLRQRTESGRHINRSNRSHFTRGITSPITDVGILTLIGAGSRLTIANTASANRRIIVALHAGM